MKVTYDFFYVSKGGSLPLASKVAASRQRFYATPSAVVAPERVVLFSTLQKWWDI